MIRSWYGRKWELSVECSDGSMLTLNQDGLDSDDKISPARVTFDINYPGYEGWYFSEFTIYNPNKATEKKIINEGARVYFSAGYQEKYGGAYGQIFGGTVFQSLYAKESVTDYKLTLLCMDGERLFKDNLISMTMIEGYKEQTLLNEIAARSRSPIDVGKITESLDQKPRPRGVTLFAPPLMCFRQIARNNGAQMFMFKDQLNMCHPTDTPQGEAILINEDTGLVGTPTQSEYGVNFRCLLNPQIVLASPPKWVVVDLSRISVVQLKAQYGTDKMVPVMPVDGQFQIGGVRHTGDTRGDSWYTDVVGYALTGKMPFQLTVNQMLNTPNQN